MDNQYPIFEILSRVLTFFNDTSTHSVQALIKSIQITALELCHLTLTIALCKVGAIIGPILQVRKPRHKEVR